jgi:ABC-type Fe2+-enterobactin transport system substrate-binding protein
MDAMRDFEGAVQTEMKKRQTAEQLQIAELETKLKAQADVIQNLSAQTSAIFAANDLTAINQLAKMSSEQAFMAEQLGEATKTLKDELAQKKTKPWYKKLLGFFGTQSEAEILASQLEIIAEKMERAQRDLQKTNAQNKVLQDGFNREAKKATDTLKAQVTKLEKLTKRQKRASNSTAA